MLRWRSLFLLRLCRLGVLAALIAVALCAPPASADSDQDRARKAMEQGQVLPLNAVLRQIRHACRGRILDAQLSQGGRGWIYRVRVLTADGRVADVAVDAQSGQLLGMSGPCG